MKSCRSLLSAAVVLCWFLALRSVLSAPQPHTPSYANLGGNRVHYTSYGSGNFAVVFVHGWNCDESVWREQALELQKTTRVITVDLLGHGMSDRPAVDYTMDVQANAVDAVLRDTGVVSAILVGHSNGTPVIRQFYRMFPAKVRGLVIVDGMLRPYGDAAMMEQFIAPLRGAEYKETVGKFVESMTAPMIDPAERARIKTMMTNAPQSVAVSEMEGLLDPALWRPDKIEVPVLMILAKQPAWTPEYEQFVREMIPQLDYQMWDGVSHFLMLDKPKEFHAALLDFVQKNKPAK
ncbi:MAG: alpha/beta hydrolase [Verrucomicrobiota bacterium]|nr:alpha/beta hydrolase [Verrucomicrobiota bacterium]